MMMRVRITIKGTVQGVGYREGVRQKALELGLKGMVRNLPDGTVDIIAEGEHDRLKEFVTSLRTAEPPLVLNAIMADFQEWKDCFDDFLVVRDLEHNGKTEQKLELGIEYLKQTNGSIKAMHEGLGAKQDETLKLLRETNGSIMAMHEGLGTKLDETRTALAAKQDETIQAIKDSIKEMHLDLVAKQDETRTVLAAKQDETRIALAAKQDEVTGAVKSMDGHMGEHFEKLDKKYDKFGDKMDELTKDMKELKELFKIFVEHYVSGHKDGEPA